jgi:hypothetical protein
MGFLRAGRGGGITLAGPRADEIEETVLVQGLELVLLDELQLLWACVSGSESEDNRVGRV